MAKYKVMLAKLGSKKDLKRKDFIFSPKLDGTRVLIYKKGNKIQLINRRDRDITHRYLELHSTWKNIKAKSCVLDAELVVLNKEGLPSFNLLQQREQLERKLEIELRSKELPATLFIFDILELEGKNLTNLPLRERKKTLLPLITPSPYIVQCPFFRNANQLWRNVLKMKLEGIMAKDVASRYEQGKRSPAWLKIKNLNTIDAAIVGYTSGAGLRERYFAALILAAYHKGKLRYIGRVGTGFDEPMLKAIKERLDKLKTKKSVLSAEDQQRIKLGRGKVRERKRVWVKPELVCEVRYMNITKQLELRAPAFLRLRYDKPVKECALEV